MFMLASNSNSSAASTNTSSIPSNLSLVVDRDELMMRRVGGDSEGVRMGGVDSALVNSLPEISKTHTHTHTHPTHSVQA